MLIDLHVHSRISHQGIQEPEEIILKAKQVGLDGVCFVENQPIKEWKALLELGKAHEVAVFFGRHISSKQGDFLFYPADAKDAAKEYFDNSHTLSFDEIRAELKALGGILAAAHPYKQNTSNPLGDRIFKLEGLDAIQVRNGSCSSIVNDFALEASFHLKALPIGGSQMCKTLETLGSAATLFAEPVNSQKELIEALQCRNAWPVEIKQEVQLRPKPQSRGGRDGGRRRDDRRGGRDNRGNDRRGRDNRNSSRR